MTTTETKTLILKYWKSWQKQDWQEMRGCLADQLNFGGQVIQADQFTEMCQQGSPWENVEMISSLFSGNEGSILYEGTDTKTKATIRVGEFIKVEDGKIKSSVACFGTGAPPA